jgi:S1-C subfamily serine protease
MKRTPIYSRSSRKARTDHAAAGATALSGAQTSPASDIPESNLPPPSDTSSAAPPPPVQGQAPARAVRHANLWLALLSGALTAFCFLGYMSWMAPQRLTQKDIDAAVMHTLKNASLPSPEVRAFEKIRPSVVRVVQQAKTGSAETKLRGVGTGVVIVDNGTILTNLHVIQGGDSTLKVHFYDGTEADAVVVKRMPENDLAVIRATSLPDDLVPATIRSTQGLAIGERVMAVGFPFNIGPSASSGIVSGLKRVYRSPDKSEVLNDLIQFDAAANPGNSGGPLITMQGEVVGIVTAILSPHEHGTFVGIGFAVPIETAAGGVGVSPF